MAITNAQLDTTAANIIYGTSTLTKGVTAMYICNTTASAVTANVFLVASGGTVADCRIYSNLSIAASDTHVTDLERIVLEQGDSIWANTSVSSGVVMTISTTGI